MTKQNPHQTHDQDENIALPGHECKNTSSTVHGINARQIFIHDAEKSKVMDEDRTSKSHARCGECMTGFFGL